MPQGNSRARRITQTNNLEDLPIVANSEPLAPDEFKEFEPHPDVWGVHATRFKKGLTKEPIIIEHPKNTVNLSKLMKESKHHFVLEDVRKRRIVCTSCSLKHGGILDAHELTHYKVEDGVLYYKGVAINRTP